jgi:hypothetical protein
LVVSDGQLIPKLSCIPIGEPDHRQRIFQPSS